MSALPRKRTCAVQPGCPLCANSGHRHSFDHCVGTLLKLQGYVEAQRFCGLEVDDQLVLGRRLQRKVSRLRAFEDAVDVPGCLAEQFVAIVTIRD